MKSVLALEVSNLQEDAIEENPYIKQQSSSTELKLADVVGLTIRRESDTRMSYVPFQEGEDAPSSSAKSNIPFTYDSSRSPIAYYEVRVVDAGQKEFVAIGLSNDSFDYTRYHLSRPYKKFS